MILEIVLVSTFIGILVTGLRVLSYCNEWEEMRRDSKYDK